MKRFLKRATKRQILYYLTGLLAVYIAGWLQTGRSYWLYYTIRQILKAILRW